jgi:hypothetical protein
MGSGGGVVGWEKIMYAAIPPPTMTMASTPDLRPVHFLEVDLAPRLPQQFLYFFPLPQGQGSLRRISDDISLYSSPADRVAKTNIAILLIRTI